MTDINPRDLIQRLAKELDTWMMAHHYGGVPPEIHYTATLVAEAGAFLSQPEPEGLTDEEIADEARKYLVNEYALPAEITYLLDSDNFQYEPTIKCFRAVIAADRARCGRPAVEPVPVSKLPNEFSDRG